MYINTNISALKAHAAGNRNQAAVAKAMEKLSTGLRINSAADDAAGSAVASLMSKQIGGMKTAIRNINDGISLVQTGESALNSVGNILLRMRDLAVQADNGTYSTTDVGNIDKEFTNLIDEIDHIIQKTDFNGINLFATAGGTAVTLQVSDEAGDAFTFTTFDGDALNTALTALASAVGSITALDTAIEDIATARADLGAVQNRLQFNSDNLSVTATNISAARSRIQDTDMAAEMAELSKNKILAQTSMNMLGQATQTTQPILQLLQQA